MGYGTNFSLGVHYASTQYIMDGRAVLYIKLVTSPSQLVCVCVCYRNIQISDDIGLFGV